MEVKNFVKNNINRFKRLRRREQISYLCILSAFVFAVLLYTSSIGRENRNLINFADTNLGANVEVYNLTPSLRATYRILGLFDVFRVDSPPTTLLGNTNLNKNIGFCFEGSSGSIKINLPAVIKANYMELIYLKDNFNHQPYQVWISGSKNNYFENDLKKKVIYNGFMRKRNYNRIQLYNEEINELVIDILSNTGGRMTCLNAIKIYGERVV